MSKEVIVVTANVQRPGFWDGFSYSIDGNDGQVLNIKLGEKALITHMDCLLWKSSNVLMDSNNQVWEGTDLLKLTGPGKVGLGGSGTVIGLVLSAGVVTLVRSDCFLAAADGTDVSSYNWDEADGQEWLSLRSDNESVVFIHASGDVVKISLAESEDLDVAFGQILYIQESTGLQRFEEGDELSEIPGRLARITGPCTVFLDSLV